MVMLASAAFAALTANSHLLGLDQAPTLKGVASAGWRSLQAITDLPPQPPK